MMEEYSNRILHRVIPAIKAGNFFVIWENLIFIQIRRKYLINIKSI